VIDDGEVQRALVIMAHPDDVDFGAAGTIAGWTDRGIEVTYAIVTDGDAGGFDRSVDRSRIAGIRHAEQRAAAAAVGVTDVRFLGYPDGALEVTDAVRRDLSRVIRQVRPRRALIQTPEWNLDFIPAACHPDHQHAGEAALRAIYPDARNPFRFPELLADEHLEPWAVEEVWFAATAAPEHAVDITANLERKLTALSAHESQFPQGSAVVMDRVREFTAAIAAGHGLPTGAHAEHFKVVSLG
jgi:LmbE family N-acetylglucosaminyl deacetylase